MKKIEKITEYVTELFKLYDMNTYGFFVDFDEETEESVEVPLFRYGRIDKDTLHKIGVNFGLTEDEILNTDKEAARRYWNKYPFFQLYRDYKAQWEWNQKFKDPQPTEEEVLLNAIFGSGGGIPVRARYNWASIKERLISQLKSVDEYIPGTYHDGAEITDLRISTQTIFSFPQCGDMIRSLIDIVDRIKELFFLALRQDLTQSEANELNFLASWIRAVDVATPSTIMTYDTICMYRDVYIEEGYDDFFEYVKFNAFVGTNPWRCKEFFDDPKLVEKLLYNFPQAKGEMRKFALELTKFECEFVWSDAEPIRYSDEEERLLEEFDDIVGEKHIPIEERAKERTYVYVDKNRSETYGWGKYIKVLKRASGPVSKGGLDIPDRSYLFAPTNFVPRIQRRVAAKHGGGNNV